MEIFPIGSTIEYTYDTGTGPLGRRLAIGTGIVLRTYNDPTMFVVRPTNDPDDMHTVLPWQVIGGR